MRDSTRFSPRSALVLLAGAALAGCAVGPNYVPPATPAAGAFAGSQGGPYSAAEPEGDFWRGFGDATLDQLVQDALLANHDLRLALGRIVEARASRREALFDLAPKVSATGGYTKQQLNSAQEGFPGGPFTTQYYDAGFDAAWELDLFGRVRRGVEARTAQAQAAEASLRDAQVSVIAEVARTYFDLRGAQARLAVARRNVQNQEDTLAQTRARFEAGRVTELDTSRAQAQLSTTLATIGPLEAAVASSIHRLSVLTGRPPTALDGLLVPPRELPALPQIAAVGDTAALLRRRPDIRTAERQLAAATALVGVAIGDLFPRVSFNGNFAYAATTPAQLGTGASQTFLIGPSISWAAFDLGRVRAQVQGSRARESQALTAYEQTVLRALEETEDALVTHARARDSLTHAQDAASASRTAAQLARTRYEGGLIDFLEVLDAERTQLAAEDSLAQSRTRTATSLVAVYKALGGAWEGAPLPRYTRAQ
jgi:multidrug efflux system outer membrane protein